MDLFGKKKTLAQANVIKAQALTIAKLEASELQLMGQIRDMDQLIFNIQQCSSWEQMRPLFNKLQEPMERRKQLESERIQAVLIPEMKKAYR